MNRTVRNNLTTAIAAGALFLGLIVACSPQPADATGDHHHPPKDCTYFPEKPGCEPPPDPCVVDPQAPGCEPEPCPPGTVRDATGECVPVVVTPPVEPPVKEPADDGNAIPRDPPMNPPNKTTGGNGGPTVTTTGCGWSRTVHPNGRITWGDGIDCSDTKEEGF